MICESFFSLKKTSASIPFHTNLRQRMSKYFYPSFGFCYLAGTDYRGRARTETTKERG